MKKVLLFALLSVSLTGFSQAQIPQEYTIHKPLRLETVNQGSASDSILVYGSDSVVKFIPRSEFGSGGGGSQNLQQTLDNGGDAVNSTGNEIHLLNDGSGVFNQYNQFVLTDDLGNSSVINQGVTAISLTSDTPISSGTVGVADGNTFLVQQTTGGSGYTKVNFDIPTENTILNFPAKSSGAYTLATTDEITLKDAITGGHFADFGTAGQNAISLMEPLEGEERRSYITHNNVDNTIGTLFGINENSWASDQRYLSYSSSIGASLGRTFLQELHYYGSEIPVGQTVVNFKDPLTATFLSFPSKTTFDSHHIIAVIDDIAINSTTITPVSGTVLTTLYPDAVLGTRIQCMDIIGGGIIYEKTATGWVQYSVTTVAP